MAKRGAEKGSEECPQALTRIEGEPFMSELKLRPPKGRPFSANCKARAARLALLAAIAAGALAVGALGAGQQRRGNEIRVQTDLVTILASVTDPNGKPIPDLTKDAFQVAEEGVPQTIEHFEAETNRPLDLALMVDASISTFKDLRFETEAAAHFIRQVVRPGDTLGVFEFTETVTRLADFSDDVPRLQTAVRQIAPGAEAGRAPARDRAGHRRRRDDQHFEV